MSLRVGFKVSPAVLSSIRERLEALQKGAGTKAIQAGVREVTVEVLREARANVPKRSGQLRKALGRKVVTYRKEVVVGVVGPRSDVRVIIDGVAVKPSNYAHLVEYGRAAVKAGSKKNRRTRKQEDTGKAVLSSKYSAVSPDQPKVFGPEVGPVASRPFLRPAWDAVKPRAVSILSKHLNAAIKQIAAKKAFARP